MFNYNGKYINVLVGLNTHPFLKVTLLDLKLLIFSLHFDSHYNISALNRKMEERFYVQPFFLSVFSFRSTHVHFKRNLFFPFLPSGPHTYLLNVTFSFRFGLPSTRTRFQS